MGAAQPREYIGYSWKKYINASQCLGGREGLADLDGPTLLFRNITFILKYKSSSDEDTKKECTPVLADALFTGLYKSVCVS